ncbi:MAG: NADH-quinone oxidoreductase subunit N [Anaerolineaceae bacterium]|nr:NADH-quinone oxidoreductase subunit N [Anaerolineaceae bacterium]
MNQTELLAFLPLIVLVSWAIILMLVDLWVPKDRKSILAFLTALGLIVSLGLTVSQSNETVIAFNGMAVVDGFGLFLTALFLVSGLAATGLAHNYIKRIGIERGEYYVLLLFSISGMILMAYANDLIIVFLALELLSIPLYILAALAHPKKESEESSLKYFILGTLAAAFVLYGISLVYAASASTRLPIILDAVAKGQILHPILFVVGAAFLLIGFAFKTAVVPFHAWAPDVYQGAPSPVTGFMSIGAKAAGIAALLRVFLTIFPSIAVDIVPVMGVLAALTMIVGNVVAVAQSNIKRLLAYSSIANGGYLLMAFVPYNQQALRGDLISAMLFHLAAYALTGFAAWAVIVAMEKEDGSGLELSDFGGLASKNPRQAMVMFVAMLSLTGIPLTLGFWGKFYLFRTVMQGGFTWLAVLGVLTSVISAFYYLRVVVYMYMRPVESEQKIEGDFWLNAVGIISAVLVIVVSFMPNWLYSLVQNALLTMF